MDGPAVWIVALLLTLGAVVVARLVLLLVRQVAAVAAHAAEQAADLERAAADLRTEVRLLGDRTARLTRRRAGV